MLLLDERILFKGKKVNNYARKIQTRTFAQPKNENENEREREKVRKKSRIVEIVKSIYLTGLFEFVVSRN